jgi:phosphotransferase system  glucose/maltose/N-acetylglucosamine-specific IIC component
MNTSSASVSTQLSEKALLKKALLICGILSSLLYAGINIYVPMLDKGYDAASQTVSELSAIGAPTRMLWVWLCAPYTLLVIAFAWGVWKSAGQNRSLRIAGGMMIAYGFLGVFWPFAPMHLRETLAAGGGTFSDTMHITLGVVTEILFLLTLGFASAALNKQFRFYSIVTFIVLLIFGILTFLDAPGVSANKPTPLMGIWERINIGVFLIWVVVLAIVLLKKNEPKINNKY